MSILLALFFYFLLFCGATALIIITIITYIKKHGEKTNNEYNPNFSYEGQDIQKSNME